MVLVDSSSIFSASGGVSFVGVDPFFAYFTALISSSVVSAVSDGEMFSTSTLYSLR